MNPIILSGPIFSAIAFGLYKATRPYEFTPDALKAIRLENENFLKLLEIMHDLNQHGLKQTIYDRVDPSEAEHLINSISLYSTTSFFKASLDIFGNQYNQSIDHLPLCYTTGDGRFSIGRSDIIKVITSHPEKYKDLLDGDEPIVNVGLLSTSVDYKALVELIKEPTQKLQSSLTYDDYTLVERLYIIHDFREEMLNSKSSKFQEDLVELHKYIDNKNDNSLIIELYGVSETYDILQ